MDYKLIHQVKTKIEDITTFSKIPVFGCFMDSFGDLAIRLTQGDIYPHSPNGIFFHENGVYTHSYKEDEIALPVKITITVENSHKENKDEHNN